MNMGLFLQQKQFPYKSVIELARFVSNLTDGMNPSCHWSFNSIRETYHRTLSWSDEIGQALQLVFEPHLLTYRAIQYSNSMGRLKTRLKGIRSRQQVLIRTLDGAGIMFLAWWPWENENCVSIHFGFEPDLEPMHPGLGRDLRAQKESVLKDEVITSLDTVFLLEDIFNDNEF